MKNNKNRPEVSSRMKYIQDEKAKKVAQFILDYAFVDDKEIYTNGAVLVPIFRVLDALSMINQEEINYSEK